MLKKAIDLGLADFGLWYGRRTRAIVYMKLDDKNVLHVWADIRGVGYGQAIDEIAKAYKGNPLAEKICYWWRKYHLNDKHAGTKRQEDLLKYCKSHGYKEQCDFLEKHSMLFDNGYKYGSAWLKEEIPANDLQDIKDFLA